MDTLHINRPLHVLVYGIFHPTISQTPIYNCVVVFCINTCSFVCISATCSLVEEVLLRNLNPFIGVKIASAFKVHC